MQRTLGILACALVGASVQAGGGSYGPSSCFVEHLRPGCDNDACCATICSVDPFCCETAWDAMCVSSASTLCAVGGPSTCPADLSADGAVDGFDLAILLANWGATNGNFADLNFDVHVDGADLAILLGAWGPCPPPLGACCFSAGCDLVTEAECQTLKGQWAGPATTCDSSQPDVPIPALVRAYTLTTPTVDPVFVASIGANAFGISGTPVEDDLVVSLDDGTRQLVVSKGNADVIYLDDAKLWNPAFAPALEAESAAIDTATTWLLGSGLAPGTVLIPNAVVADVKSDSGLVPNHWLVRFDAVVDAVQGIDSMPVWIPLDDYGVEVRVAGGEIIGFHGKAQVLGVGDAVSTRSVEAIDALAAMRLGFAPACPETHNVRYLLPAAEGAGTIKALPDVIVAAAGEHGAALAVPASPQAPYVAIEAFRSERTFAPGEPITLSATVVGGTPPYSFVWIDSLEQALDVADDRTPADAIATTNPATVTLRCGSHPIGLWVRDANGLLATDSREVNVDGAPSECDTAATPRDDQRSGLSCTVPPEGSLTYTAKIPGWHGWKGDVSISNDDGLALSGVTYSGARLADSMTLSYYRLETAGMALQTGQLTKAVAANGLGNLRAVLQAPGVKVFKNAVAVFVTATWCIDAIPAGNTSGRMHITQTYVFEQGRTNCSPMDISSAAPFHPYITTRYQDRVGGTNAFKKLKTFQRFDWQPFAASICALHSDPDDLTVLVPTVLPPPPRETFRTVANFGVAGNADNYHERDGQALVGIPGCAGLPPIAPNPFAWLPGQPLIVVLPAPPYPIGTLSCIHVHWRWDKTLDPAWGGSTGPGSPLPPVSQLVRIWLVRFNPGELDPSPAISPIGYLTPAETIGNVARDLVMWHEVEATVAPSTLGAGHWFFR